MTITRAELVDRVAAMTGLPKTHVDRAVRGALDVVAETLAKGGEVRIYGFGAFTTRRRGAREGRNISNGEKIALPALKVPAFRPSRALRDAVAGSEEACREG